MAVIKGHGSKRLWRKFCRNSKPKSSNDPTKPKASKFCRVVGWLNARSLGWGAAAVSPKIGKISPAPLSLTFASPQSASCSENFAILHNVSGRTLRHHDLKAFNPTAGIVACPTDMARYFHALLTGKLLSPHHSKMLHEASVPFAHPKERWRYSPALHHMHPGNENTSGAYLGHGGMVNGMFAYTSWYAPLNLTISAMINATGLPPDVNHEFTGHVYPKPFVDSLFQQLESTVEEMHRNKGGSVRA